MGGRVNIGLCPSLPEQCIKKNHSQRNSNRKTKKIEFLHKSHLWNFSLKICTMEQVLRTKCADVTNREERGTLFANVSENTPDATGKFREC